MILYIWENKGTDQRHNNLTADQHLYFHHLSNKSMSSTVLLNSVLFIVPHTDTDNTCSCMLEICALIMARFYAKLL